MNRKSFNEVYAISSNNIPAMLSIAEKLADSKNIWFVSELSIRNEHDPLFPEESNVLRNISQSPVSHRYILLIVDDENRNNKLYTDVSMCWQELNGIVLYTTTTEKQEILERIVNHTPLKSQARSLMFLPNINAFEVSELLPALGYLGTIQKQMIENQDIAAFLNIDLDVLELNPAVAIYKE